MSALTHVVVGTNDLARARAFYDATLSMLGLRRVRDFDRASIDVGSRKSRLHGGDSGEWSSSLVEWRDVSFAAPTREAVRNGARQWRLR